MTNGAKAGPNGYFCGIAIYLHLMNSENRTPKVLSIIAAMSENRCVGQDGHLPWKLPDEWAYFKKTTHGKPFLIGRTSYESPDGLYSSYRNVVVSSQKNLALPHQPAEQAHSLAEALALLADEEEVFVLGGASIFEELLPRADKLYLTIVHTTVNGDAFFPEINWADWEEIYSDCHEADEKHEFAFSMKRYQRIRELD